MKIEEKVIEIISGNIETECRIHLETKFSEIPFDSVVFIKTIVQLEEEFEIEFEDEALLLTAFSGVEAIVEHVKKECTKNGCKIK